MNALLKFEIPAAWNRERVTTNCMRSYCGLCFPMKNQMLKVCISASRQITWNAKTTTPVKTSWNTWGNHTRRRTLLNELIFYLLKKAWGCYYKSLLFLLSRSHPFAEFPTCDRERFRTRWFNNRGLYAFVQIWLYSSQSNITRSVLRSISI